MSHVVYVMLKLEAMIFKRFQNCALKHVSKAGVDGILGILKKVCTDEMELCGIIFKFFHHFTKCSNKNTQKLYT